MRELHSLLANLEANKHRANEVTTEILALFTSKAHYLEGIQKVYRPFNEAEDYQPDNTIKHLVTTVSDKLNFAQPAFIKALDEEISKNETNRNATAKLKIGGKEIELSISSLMDLEKRIQGLRLIYLKIPTLDMTKKWSPAKIDQKAFESEREETFATVPKYTVLELAAATKEHKAQVEKLKNNVAVGVWEATHYSGRIMSSDKAELLARIDEVLASIRVARTEANRTEVKEIKIGKDIFDHINQGII